MRGIMAALPALSRWALWSAVFLAVALSACSSPSVVTHRVRTPAVPALRVVISVQTFNPVHGVRAKSVGPSPKVTSFYHAILAIPKSPPPWSCGKVTGYYVLRFYRGSMDVGTVELPIAGCSTVVVEIPGKSPYDAMFQSAHVRGVNVWYLLAQLVHRSVGQLYRAQL